MLEVPLEKNTEEVEHFCWQHWLVWKRDSIIKLDLVSHPAMEGSQGTGKYIHLFYNDIILCYDTEYVLFTKLGSRIVYNTLCF